MPTNERPGSERQNVTRREQAEANNKWLRKAAAEFSGLMANVWVDAHRAKNGSRCLGGMPKNVQTQLIGVGRNGLGYASYKVICNCPKCNGTFETFPNFTRAEWVQVQK